MEFSDVVKWVKQQKSPESAIRDISRAVLLHKLQSSTEKVEKYLACMTNLGEVSFPQVAKYLYMSERSLSRSLQNEGTSFRKLLNIERMKRCDEFLKNQDLKGKDIAERLGFLEPSYFYRWFKHTNQVNFTSANYYLAKKHRKNG